MTPQRHLQTRVWPKLGSPMPYSLTSTCLNIIPRSPKLTQAHPSSPSSLQLALSHQSSPKLVGSLCAPSLQVRQQALQEQHVRTSADQRALEDERRSITEERAALGEDRLRTSRAAEAVRQGLALVHVSAQPAPFLPFTD